MDIDTALLRRTGLFQDMEDGDIRRLLDCLHCPVRRYGRGEFLWHAGDAVPMAGIVLEARNDMACIGIIGGADGPTAIVCGGSSKEKLHAACSALHFEPVEGDIEWRIVFNIKNSNEMSLELI